MSISIPLILRAALEDDALPWGGDHGVAHWARVCENGLRPAEGTRANIEVVRLFAVLHDSRRIDERTDPDADPVLPGRPGRWGTACSTCRLTRSACSTWPAPGTRTSGRIPTSRSGPAGTPTAWTSFESGSRRTRVTFQTAD